MDTQYSKNYCDTLLKKCSITWNELIKVVLIKYNCVDENSACSIQFICDKILSEECLINKDDYPLKILKNKDGSIRKKDWILKNLNHYYNAYTKKNNTGERFEETYIIKEHSSTFQYIKSGKEFKKIYIINELLELKNKLIDYEYLVEENNNFKIENKKLKDGYNKLNKEHLQIFTFECPICMDEIERDRSKYRGMCGHSVCKACYDKINTDYLHRKKCPICRDDWSKNVWIVST